MPNTSAPVTAEMRRYWTLLAAAVQEAAENADGALGARGAPDSPSSSSPSSSSASSSPYSADVYMRMTAVALRSAGGEIPGAPPAPRPFITPQQVVLAAVRSHSSGPGEQGDISGSSNGVRLDPVEGGDGRSEVGYIDAISGGGDSGGQSGVSACGSLAVEEAGDEAVVIVVGDGDCVVRGSSFFYGFDVQPGLGGMASVSSASSDNVPDGSRCLSCPLVTSDTMYWVRPTVVPILFYEFTVLRCT